MRRTLRLQKSLPPNIRSVLSKHAEGGSGEVSVNGWLRNVRIHKNVAFAEVDDGSGSVQGVWKGKGRADDLTMGSSVRLSGSLQTSKGAGQEVELIVDKAEILGSCDPETYPIQKKSLPNSFLRDHAHLRFRTSLTSAVMRVRDGLMRDWHDWFEENGFVHIHTPILTSSDCEGAGEVFAISDPISSSSTSSSSSSSSPVEPVLPRKDPFFLYPVNLTVSSQLHLEPPLHALGRTYTLSPSFRAEPSLTSRHLSEFYMLEGELAFVDTLDGLLDLVEASIQGTLSRLMWGDGPRHIRTRDDLGVIMESLSAAEDEGGGSGGMDFDIRGERPPLLHLVNTANRPFGRMTYTEAIRLLQEQHEEEQWSIPPVWGNGLATEHEKWLARDHPVFVTHYPRHLKPFYMLPSSADSSFSSSGAAEGEGETVACFDLLFPGVGEMAGGSLREYRLPELEKAMGEHGMDRRGYEWYLDLRRYGSVPHGGWGMGWDRWVCWVTGIGNIRDVVAYPRWKGNCRY